MKPVVIGTRGSALALAQTRLVFTDLKKAWPRRTFEIRTIKTQGDFLSENPATTTRRLGQQIAKGLFTGELERALRDEQIHIAVHSLKDLPTEDAPGLILGAFPPRIDPRDVLVTRGVQTVEELPPHARVATGSVRRAAQLRLARPDLEIMEIRGNIDTRIRKFRERSDLMALILAAAGLERLRPSLSGLAATPIPFELMLPAPGQGALALQVRKDDPDVRELVQALHDVPTAAAVTAERTLLNALGGGCQEPIAAYGVPGVGGKLRLEAVAWLFGETEPRRGQLIGRLDHPEQLGADLAAELSR